MFFWASYYLARECVWSESVWKGSMRREGRTSPPESKRALELLRFGAAPESPKAAPANAAPLIGPFSLAAAQFVSKKKHFFTPRRLFNFSFHLLMTFNFFSTNKKKDSKPQQSRLRSECAGSKVKCGLFGRGETRKKAIKSWRRGGKKKKKLSLLARPRIFCSRL